MSENAPFIDRCALIVRPTWKFAEWLRSLEDEFVPDEHSVFSQTVYLVEESNLFDAAATAGVLEACYHDIAANEFSGWWTDESDWPQLRSLSDFLQYFEVSPSEIVVDLAGEESCDN